MNDQNATAFILIVEDSLGAAHALQRALGLYQDGLYQVRTCDSGESALKLLHQTPFDLLISDIRLPGIDGLELVERARRIRPGIRTIFITAYGSPEVEARARELANAYIVKPFRLQEFIGLVERVLTEPAPIWQPITKPRLGYQGIADVEIETGKRKNAHLIVLAFDVDGTLASEYTVDFLPKIKIEVVLADNMVTAGVDAIVKAARTGKIGDGKVFVSPIDNAVRIRTEETGEAAV